jgi:hypothetical protein
VNGGCGAGRAVPGAKDERLLSLGEPTIAEVRGNGRDASFAAVAARDQTSQIDSFRSSALNVSST